MAINIIKVILPAVVSFIIGILTTPILTNFLYKHKMWKKKAKTVSSVDGSGTPIFNSLHKYERPKEIFFIPKFKETATGKIMRKETLTS